MRDLHTLFWIAKYVYHVRNPHDLLDKRCVRPAQCSISLSAAARLSLVGALPPAFRRRTRGRAAVLRSSSARLRVRLGYTEHPGMRDVERFMKHYFLVAKGRRCNLTAILCAKARGSAGQARAGAEPDDVAVRAEHREAPRCPTAMISSPTTTASTSPPRPDVFKHDPVNLIRIFRLAQKNNLAFHPDAMRDGDALARSDQRAAAREPEEANRLFMEILTSEQRRDRAAPDERDRRARHSSSALGQIVVDDAVQHVSSLHRRRASDPLRRLPGRTSSAAASRSSRSPAIY